MFITDGIDEGIEAGFCHGQPLELVVEPQRQLARSTHGRGGEQRPPAHEEH